MKPVESSLEYRVLLPEQTSSAHPTLIMLHGRGADEEDLVGLSKYLNESLLIISARAPYPFPYGNGYTWYDMQVVGTPDPTMFKSSYDKLVKFVSDMVASYPIDRSKVFLLGFSMGTVMSYALALTQPELIAGVVANSGYIPEGTHLEFKWTELSGTRFFVAHGTFDPVIPVRFGRRAKELLEKANAGHTYNEYPMGHEISQQSLTDMTEWMKDQIHSLR